MIVLKEGVATQALKPKVIGLKQEREYYKFVSVKFKIKQSQTFFLFGDSN